MDNFQSHLKAKEKTIKNIKIIENKFIISLDKIINNNHNEIFAIVHIAKDVLASFYNQTYGVHTKKQYTY